MHVKHDLTYILYLNYKFRGTSEIFWGSSHRPKSGAIYLCSHIFAGLVRCVQGLTILPVVCDLHLALLGPGHRLWYHTDGFLVRQVTMEEVTGARLLHDVRSREARHLTKAIVAVYDCTVLHPSIGYHKFSVCMERKKYAPMNACCDTSDLRALPMVSAHW